MSALQMLHCAEKEGCPCYMYGDTVPIVTHLFHDQQKKQVTSCKKMLTSGPNSSVPLGPSTPQGMNTSSHNTRLRHSRSSTLRTKSPRFPKGLPLLVLGQSIIGLTNRVAREYFRRRLILQLGDTEGAKAYAKRMKANVGFGFSTG